MRQRAAEIQNQQKNFTTNIDPFLSGSDAIILDHSRQESADSGLGLSHNLDLPYTPNDLQNADDLGLDSLSITNMDLETDAMDLMCLPEELNTDIVLSDLEAFLTNANITTSKDVWI